MILNLTDLSEEPLQAQIVRQVRAAILAGYLPAEENLPSIRSLAREQRVSVITVQRAYETLEGDGLIHARRGKGFFVSNIAGDQKKTMAVQRLREGLEPHFQAAMAEGLEKSEIRDTIDSILDKE